MEGLGMQSLPVKGLHCETELKCCRECEDVCIARRQSNSRNDFKNKETSGDENGNNCQTECFTWQNVHFNSRLGKNLVFFFFLKIWENSKCVLAKQQIWDKYLRVVKTHWICNLEMVNENVTSPG